MVLLSANAQSTTFPAELPRIHATTPLPYKNLDGQGGHTAPVKFSAVPAKNSSSNLDVEFLYGLASKFSYGYRGPL